MFRSPQPKNIKIDEILGPFHIKVWYLMGAFLVLSTFALSKVFQNENDEKAKMSYSNSLLTIVGAISQQSKPLFKVTKFFKNKYIFIV